MKHKKAIELFGEDEKDYKNKIKEQEEQGWILFGQEPIEKIIVQRIGTRYLFKTKDV